MSRHAQGRPPRTAGLSLLEMLVVITLVMIMVGGAFYNYTTMINEQKIGKASNECHQYVKALKAWENKIGRPVPQYFCPDCHAPWFPSKADVYRCAACRSDYRGGGGIDRRIRFSLGQLEYDRIMPNIPDDPWSIPYDINTTSGFVFSCGPDSLPYTNDDVRVSFRPPFELQRASYDKANRAVVAAFSRALDRTRLDPKTISVEATGPITYTTLSVDLQNPYRLKAFLPETATASSYKIIVGTPGIPANDGILATDGTSLDVSRVTSAETDAP